MKYRMLATAIVLVCSSQLNAQWPASPLSSSFTTLIDFDNTDGGNPAGSLVQGLDGNLYGTTFDGGNTFANCLGPNCGTAFRISPSGTLTTIYSFCSQANCADGGNPAGPLVLGVDGNFYGITEVGGTGAGCYAANACGTVFKITPGGTLTTIYNWCSQPNCADGEYSLTPESGAFVQAADGIFYGTNDTGGASSAGTAFKLTPTGSLTTLYTFCSQTNCADGSDPEGGLTRAADGDFYGVTQEGGGASGAGTVFKLTPGGALTTLYDFCSQTNCTDGALPSGPLIQATDGNFYGTTEYGGANVNSAACARFDGYCGTVFKITPRGALMTIYSFCSLANCADGFSPANSVVEATDGNLYGPTAGTYQYGITLFRLTPKGKLTTLYTFNTQFQTPEALFQATNGTFYGVTLEGGTSEACTLPCGIAFSLDTGLRPFVQTVPTFGHVADLATILGNGLSDATDVRFNGKRADFEVISDTEILAAVPDGATTGFVTVTWSGTRLKSNVEFQVIR
jgi:uncharacterized repeat protein (TIGR03803 family)